MIDNDAELIRRLKVATNDKPYNENPVVSSKDIVDAEALLGFSLPPLLKSIYLEVRDGGFGKC
ncbi:SMI1/KNR4 family protein [Tengunoibacter tsumagoiensis]|uniref:Knr4/Smi1-like domain-containing protein n=1 Tax=Tengunoibacter tsumagoiensis TaxID=2014871 RepID=A0A401ZUN7_9CHLR|nr:SMI1/KNR4 family protein [Tengunoibacter tsumagoiensis]GCE10593.1 hypothetical protein KTT_04520 [Tengunoibacter tsumagoiensis]